MKHFPHIVFAAKSDVGRKRKNNEDCFGVFPEMGVFCVADGMGGGDDGEVASAAVVNAIDAFIKECPLPPNATYPIDGIVAGIRKAVGDASAWIYDRAKKNGLKGCGSTFVGICLDAANPKEAVVLHAGDSRLYHIRGGRIHQVTRDHSAAELMGAKNENEINPMFRGMILRAVGVQPVVDVERTELSIKEQDWILVCSDGLTKMVSDKKILKIIRSAENTGAAVDALVGAANDCGGLDNVTVLLLKIGKLPPPLPASLFVPKNESTASTIAKTEESTAVSSTCSTGGASDVMFDEESSGGAQIADEEGEVAVAAAEALAEVEQPRKLPVAKRLLKFVGRANRRRGVVASVLSVAMLAIVATGILSRDREKCQSGLEMAVLDIPPGMIETAVDRQHEDVLEQSQTVDQEKMDGACRQAEEEARRQAEEEARKAKEAQRKAEEEAKRQAEEEARRQAEEEARRQAEEEARKAEEEAKRQAEEEARRQAEEARRQALNLLAGVCTRENVDKIVKRLESTCAVECQELREKFHDQALSLGGGIAKCEDRERLAGEFVETMKAVAGKCMSYAMFLREYFEDEIRDDAQTLTADKRKEMEREIDKLEKFISHASQLTEGSISSDSETYKACSWMILNIPRSF